jgi:hypothetical protein
MAHRRPAPAPHTPVDDFQRAAAEAEANAGKRAWLEMSPAEQTRAIYAKLRRIDADHAAAMAFSPGRPGRYRVAGETVRRRAAEVRSPARPPPASNVNRTVGWLTPSSVAMSAPGQTAP